MAHIVMYEIFDPPPISRWELHNVPLQPPFRSIAGHGLAAGRRRWFVISTDPGRKALVGHLSRDIAVYGGDKLIVEVLLGAILGCE